MTTHSNDLGADPEPGLETLGFSDCDFEKDIECLGRSPMYSLVKKVGCWVLAKPIPEFTNNGSDITLPRIVSVQSLAEAAKKTKTSVRPKIYRATVKIKRMKFHQEIPSSRLTGYDDISSQKQSVDVAETTPPTEITDYIENTSVSENNNKNNNNIETTIALESNDYEIEKITVLDSDEEEKLILANVIYSLNPDQLGLLYFSKTAGKQKCSKDAATNTEPTVATIPPASVQENASPSITSTNSKDKEGNFSALCDSPEIKSYMLSLTTRFMFPKLQEIEKYLLDDEIREEFRHLLESLETMRSTRISQQAVHLRNVCSGLDFEERKLFLREITTGVIKSLSIAADEKMILRMILGDFSSIFNSKSSSENTKLKRDNRCCASSGTVGSCSQQGVQFSASNPGVRLTATNSALVDEHRHSHEQQQQPDCYVHEQQQPSQCNASSSIPEHEQESCFVVPREILGNRSNRNSIQDGKPKLKKDGVATARVINQKNSGNSTEVHEQTPRGFLIRTNVREARRLIPTKSCIFYRIIPKKNH